MKKVVYTMLVASFALFSCGGEEKKDDKKKEEKKEDTKEEVVEKVTWTVDPAATTLEWTGYKGDDPTGDFHKGQISVSEGDLITQGTKVTGGNFKIAMNTIAETTEGADPTYAEKLIKHLSNEDFFNIESFPIAELIITGSEENKVMGDLKVMDKTIQVEIPYEVNVEGDKANFTSEFTVDFSALALPGMQLEEGGEPKDKVSDKVNFILRMTVTK